MHNPSDHFTVGKTARNLFHIPMETQGFYVLKPVSQEESSMGTTFQHRFVHRGVNLLVFVGTARFHKELKFGFKKGGPGSKKGFEG